MVGGLHIPIWNRNKTICLELALSGMGRGLRGRTV
jgi:hypothetical protein